MKGPHETPIVVGEPQQREAHQRCGAEIESSEAVIVEERREFVGEEIPRGPRESDVFFDELLWFVTGPIEAEAQRFMAPGRAFPCSAEAGRVQGFAKCADQLLNVAAGFGVLESVRDHALLKWCHRQ